MRWLLLLCFTASCIAQTPTAKPVVDWQYLALNGANAGAAGLDLWSTHRLLVTGQYKEGNPLMPKTTAGQAGVEAGIIAGAAWSSWYLKKHGSKWWLLAPVVGIGAHGFGATWNLTR